MGKHEHKYIRVKSYKKVSKGRREELNIKFEKYFKMMEK